MKDELKREICTIAHSGFQKDYMSSCECDYDADKVADSILSLLAPTIEKAEKWDKLKDIARYRYKMDCSDCPMQKIEQCTELCECLSRVIKSLNVHKKCKHKYKKKLEFKREGDYDSRTGAVTEWWYVYECENCEHEEVTQKLL